MKVKMELLINEKLLPRGQWAFFGPLNSRKNKLCLFKKPIPLFPDYTLIVEMPKYITMDKIEEENVPFKWASKEWW